MRFQSDSNIITLAAALLLAAGCKPKPPPDDGQIHALYPLRQVLNESERIVEGVVDGQEGGLVDFRVGPVHKGACPVSRFRLKTLPASGILPGEAAEVRRLLTPGSRVVAFTQGNAMLLYVGRCFVMAYGDGKTQWGYSAIETHSNRTFNGSVGDLCRLIPDVLEGRVKAPPPMEDLPQIDIDALRSLPAPGQPVDEEYLPRAFRRGRPSPPAPRPPEQPLDVEPGVRYEVFRGTVPAASLDSLTPVSKGEAALPGSVEPASTEPATFRYRGYLDVPADGEYFLILRGQAAAELSLGQAELVKHEGGKVDRGADVDLKAGRHAFTLTSQGPVQLLWSGPGFAAQPVPAERLFRGK